MTPITKTIRLDLARPAGMDFLTTVHAVQGDAYSRFLAFALYSSGEEYTPSEGTTCLIGGVRPDGSILAAYSSISQNGASRSAYAISGNILTVELSPAACSQAGNITLTFQLIGSGGEILSSWPIACRIEPNAVELSTSDPDLPSESASSAAARAEAAAARAEAAAAKIAAIPSAEGVSF